ncbi:DNA cytosine methyltransferase [Marinoscillum sp.]|uniref:DNA cytosine methyltransferase n=1 Tax=Marinoscillum sp. TaxID=2024838 RepID=UPI003BAD1F49
MLKAVDFFSGAGGMTCGLRQAHIKVLGGIDIESQFGKSYEASNPGSKFLERDISKYQPYQLQSDLGLDINDDELVLVGCSPCQYWSSINTNRHNGSYTKNLLEDFHRFVDYFNPGYVVVENVPGFRKKPGNYVLLNFLDFLTTRGYSFHEDVVNVMDYGVPQSRKRYHLIATRMSTEAPYPVRRTREGLTVRNFIGRFNFLKSGETDQSDHLHTAARLTPLNLKRIQSTSHNGGNRLEWANEEELQLNCFKGKDHIFRDVYARMYWDRQAPTITTRFNSISNGRFGHPEQDRGLSLREGATLQTFPLDYIFLGNQASIAKQIGNAVPPNFAKHIGLALTNHHNAWRNLKQEQEHLTY